MRIISLFSVYFLILMLIHGIIAVFVDSKFLIKKNYLGAARKARWMGIFAIIISAVLYILKNTL